MTYPENYTLSADLLARISEDGLDALPEAIRLLVNAAMHAERQKHLGVGPYERSEARADQANGFKPKTVQTRVGEITFAVPQVRHGDFYPQALEKGLRSERALKLALAEMYVQGVSTRKVAAILEELCGTQVSSMPVSRATAALDPVLERWRSRPLGEIVFLLVDARYERVRVDGQGRDVAVLWATGIARTGQRSVLGVSVALSEAEVHWRDFLSSLVGRGLRGVRLIVSDAHEGLAAARRAVFGGVPWQRCQFQTIRTQFHFGGLRPRRAGCSAA
jgi:transposase-like protein